MPSNTQPRSLLLNTDNAGFSVFRRLAIYRAACIKVTLYSELSRIMAKNDTKLSKVGLIRNETTPLSPLALKAAKCIFRNTIDDQMH